MAIHLRIKLENGVNIDKIISIKEQKKIEKLKSYRKIENNNNRRFKTYQKGGKNWFKLPKINLDIRLSQLTDYIKELKEMEV